MENIRTTVRKNFTRLVDSSGMTKREIAQQMNISEATLQRWKSGTSFPEHTNIEKLAKILGVSDTEFYVQPVESDKPKAKVTRIKGRTTDLLNELVIRREKVPDDVIDMAQDFNPNDEVWDEIRVVFKAALQEKEPDASRKSQGA